jgi:pimeloyl-ACP methyl ester carboxylesterase
VPELGKSTQVCAYDRAGLGYSDQSPSPRTSGHIAKELALLIERSGIRGPVVLAAASLGGLSARVFASEYRDRAGGLVLIDASHERQRERLAAVGLDEPMPPGLKLVVMSASLGLLRLRGETLGLEPGRADPSVRKYLEATAHRASRYRAAYDELNQWPESVKQVAASTLPPDLPVIVLTAGVGYGAAEKIHRELQDDLATLTDRACQVIARHSGHVISNDDPRLVVAAIRELIQASSERRVPDCDGLITRDKGA